MCALRLVAFAGVIAAGLLFALPFRHSKAGPAIAASPPQRALNLTLRQPDYRLEASPPGDVSPATGMLSTEPPLLPHGPAVHEASYFVPTRPDLERLTPPPDLPIEFKPAPADSAPGLHANEWQPARRPLNRRDHLPREYRLRDGDTLEKLAARFLGSASRADEIYAANRGALSTPELLPIGATIVIPPKIAGGELQPAP